MSELDTTSEILLSLISHLDSYGAQEWSLRTVTATSAAVFLGMRMQIGHKFDIDWDAFVHALVSGIGSAICIYLNMYAAVAMNGVTEPLGSIQCNGPLTSLHRIIPAITQGYAICDIINGFRLGPAFLAHGIATFTVVGIFNEFNASHILTPMLVMEVSTIVLAILRANFFTPLLQLVTQATFALLFFVCRIIISPMVHYDITSSMLLMSEDMGKCFPKLIFYTTILFGTFFHGLNAFWFVKLLKKIKRKLTKEESLEMKDLNEE
mmetsp:Transcript_20899/g.26385  ORF Transcript_20899/g.26385 Transcript_20899/m.26385 type:complete len:265 (-) Transcript_20899:199-993(-)|eukprot:CAMPEP_0203664222 /NCGR_PEP_ID=MMETSP0090-20130426/1679_1 /ASSEMBLY_ACC=CAM_ASM_001088 /TAXON_ID=426623 /ORGANISM="Chaetoceros affinis, Strain CCMP159" /LENGTH=264 /DNA_ID=CAMNT_0050527389 /DNA_START=46 /DNA_END=840 /DNA_ORIENTATION=-